MGLGAGCLLAVSDSGTAVSWLSESGWGAESELVCGAAAVRAEVTMSGCFFFSFFWAFGASRGPRTFRWELQNSRKRKKH